MSTIQPQQGNILVVDDSLETLDLLLKRLFKRGYQVRTAISGERAIESARADPPDLILLDILMPGMDGFEVCKQLKADERTRDVPIIFISALGEKERVLQAFRTGGVDYVTKPFQWEEVLARVETHLTLRKLQRSYQEEIAELDAFAHTVAHDLKSPLTSLIASLELLSNPHRELLAEQRAERLHSAARSARKMHNIIEELLLLAGIRRDEVLLTPLDMGRIVMEVFQRVDFLIEEAQAKIVIPNEWPQALGYGPWVEEIWINYVGNALKYGGAPPLIEVGGTLQEDGMVRFWVRDNGAGLKQEDLSRLFIPFTQLNQVQAKGQGLGLSIVRRIVERLGGQVGVESKIGAGSTFSFTLPGVRE
jgi:signal transduction histidine kinase